MARQSKQAQKESNKGGGGEDSSSKEPKVQIDGFKLFFLI